MTSAERNEKKTTFDVHRSSTCFECTPMCMTSSGPVMLLPKQGNTSLRVCKYMVVTSTRQPQVPSRMNSFVAFKSYATPLGDEDQSLVKTSTNSSKETTSRGRPMHASRSFRGQANPFLIRCALHFSRTQVSKVVG